MATDHEQFMRIALEEAQKSRSEGNIAVGSVITRDGQVVARGRNNVTSTFDPTAHAETVALREAGAACKQVEFHGHTLYTTFEPCPMCCGAILASGISRLVIGSRYDPALTRWGGYSVESLLEITGRAGTIEVVDGILTKPCYDIWRASTGS